MSPQQFKFFLQHGRAPEFKTGDTVYLVKTFESVQETTIADVRYYDYDLSKNSHYGYFVTHENYKDGYWHESNFFLTPLLAQQELVRRAKASRKYAV